METGISEMKPGDCPAGPVVKTSRSHSRGPGSVPGQGTRSHILQLGVCKSQPKTLGATAKTQLSQINGNRLSTF